MTLLNSFVFIIPISVIREYAEIVLRFLYFSDFIARSPAKIKRLIHFFHKRNHLIIMWQFSVLEPIIFLKNTHA